MHRLKGRSLKPKTSERVRTGAIFVSVLGLSLSACAERSPADGLRGRTDGLSIVSAASGLWNDPATWGGQVPAAGDAVTIASGHAVTYNDTTPDVLGGVQIDGTLVFAPDTNLELKSEENIIVGGTLQMHPSSTAVNHTVTFVNVDEAAFQGGGMVPLPSDVGLWITGDGLLDAIGTHKNSWTRLTGSANQHDTSITVEDASGWQLGDTVVIVPTEPPTDAVGDAFWSGYDQRTIAGISGNTLTLSGELTRNHPEVNGQWRAEVLNLTRNVVLQGAPQHRAHVMFTHVMQSQTLKDIEIRHMGPRKVDPSIDPPGTTVGVLGRYGLHFHMAEAVGHLVDGVVVHDVGSHAFVPHKTHGVTIRNSISHNTWDEAYWYDAGQDNAPNNLLLDHNVASKNRPDPFFRGFRLAGFVLGLGYGNELKNSVAVGITGASIAAGFHWPENTVKGVWKFHDNISHNNRIAGISTWQNGEEHHIVENSVAYYNGDAGINHGAYGTRYLYRNMTLYGNDLAGVLIHSHSSPDQVSPQTFENILIDGAGITRSGFLIGNHNTQPGLPAATLIEKSTVRNLAPGASAVKWYYNDKAQGVGDRGYDPPPDPPPFPPNPSNHREWLRVLKSNDFSGVPEDKLFYLPGTNEADGPHGLLPESDIFVARPNGAVLNLRSLHFNTTFTDDFEQVDLEAPTLWRWHWIPQRVSGSTSATSGDGKGTVVGAGSTLFYVKSREAIDVDQSVKVRVNDGQTFAGLFARRGDFEDRETYYKLDVGDLASGRPLTISKVVDGVRTNIVTGSDYLAAGTDYNIAFRVAAAPGGTDLQARLWPVGGGAPGAPSLQVLDPQPLLAGRRGRFGVSAETDAGGSVVFDDYTSTILDNVTFNAAWNSNVQTWAPAGTPIVEAGPNRSALQPNAVIAIDATVTDNGVANPPTGLTYSWTAVSAPGTVTFSNPSGIDTLASFSAPGQYVLRLSASDGARVGSDDVHVVVNPPQTSGPVLEAWNGPDFSNWPAQWTAKVGGSPTIDVFGNQGRIRYVSGGGGSVREYINDHNGENVDLVASVNLSANGSIGGLFARQLDSDSNTYLGAKFGATGFPSDYARIFMVVDGESYDLAYMPSPFVQATQYRMRFKVETNSNGTMNLRFRVWNTPTEPTSWTLQVLDWSNSIFQGRAGRFGVIGDANIQGRAVTFDDFQADVLDVPAVRVVTENWTGNWGGPWPQQLWATETLYGPEIITIVNNQGRMFAQGTYAAGRAYLKDYNALDVDIVTSVVLNLNGAQAGCFARRNDSDNGSYVGAKFGVTGFESDSIRLFYQDHWGSVVTITSKPSPFLQTHLYTMHFRTETNPDGTVNLRFKIWEPSVTPVEPPGWNLDKSNVLLPSPIRTRPGRFGLLHYGNVSGRSATYDDFTATFVEQ